jgi:very-short-patch-repair endonuclease
LDKDGHTVVPKGKNETKILNLIESVNNVKIDRKFRIFEFYPDGYCHETNTIYEVYEKYHSKPKQRKYDEMRRHMIQDELKCDFVVIWDDKELNTERHNYVQT